MAWIDLDDLSARSLGLVFKHQDELAPCGVADWARQHSACESPHPQVFDCDDVISPYDFRAEMVQVICAAPGRLGAAPSEIGASSVSAF